MATLANATPKQLQNNFLQRFFPVASGGNVMGMTMPGNLAQAMSLGNEGFRNDSMGGGNNRETSLKNLRNSADSSNRQTSYLFNNKINRKVKKTGTSNRPAPELLNNT